jgi:hypothetical protein
MFEKSKECFREASKWSLRLRKFHLESIRVNLALFKRAYISHSAYLYGLRYHMGCVDRIDEQIRARHFTLLRECY